MKVILSFCKEVINLVVSFNLWYYDVNNNKFKILIIVDIKTLTEQNLKQSCNKNT